MARFEDYRPYWRYFTSLEKQLENTRQYCEFSENNYETFSDEYIKIIMLSAAHFENVAKALLAEKSPSTNISSLGMDKLRTQLITVRAGLADMTVPVQRTGLTISPLSEWKSHNKADWWEAYNKLKHDFLANVKLGNQLNALRATSACMVVLLYFFEDEIKEISPYPSLFYYERPPLLLGASEPWQKLP